MSHRLLALAALLAGTTLSSVPAAAGQFEFVSQSVIVMKGIPPRKPRREATVVAVSAPNRETTVKTLTDEERRLLRYGVAQESKDKLAEAAREVEEPVAEEPEKEVAVASEPAPSRFDASNTTVNVAPPAPTAADPVAWESTASQKPDKAKLQAHARRQAELEAPKAPNRGAAKLARDREARRGVADPDDPLAADKAPEGEALRDEDR